MKIKSERSDYHASHEDKKQPFFYVVTEGKFPHKKTLLKIFNKNNRVEIHSGYFTKDYLKEVFSPLEAEIGSENIVYE